MPNPYGWRQNEPQIKPKDQGGDSISTFAAKIKEAITSLFNTLNSYPWSNATQSAAGYMSAEDKALVDSIPGLGTFNKMFFSQTSGSYIAPRDGVYRITLKGGGGGGSYQQMSAYNSWTGAGGGEGGTLIFYKTLTKNQSYPYSIGAGGAAGTGSTDALSPGQSGGASNFNSNEYVVSGGGRAPAAGYTDMGGDGGHTYTVPTGANAFFIPGQTGQSGYHFLPSALANEGYPVKSVSGGGQTARYTQPLNNFGEGGNGGGTANPTAGGSGFILIEYAG